MSAALHPKQHPSPLRPSCVSWLLAEWADAHLIVPFEDDDGTNPAIESYQAAPGERWLVPKRVVYALTVTAPQVIGFALLWLGFLGGFGYWAYQMVQAMHWLIVVLLLPVWLYLCLLFAAPVGFAAYFTWRLAWAVATLPAMLLAAAAVDLSVSGGSLAARHTSRGIDALASITPRKVERVAKLLAFLLPPSIRADSFLPIFEELREDFAQYRKRYMTRGARAWLAGCFLARVVVLYLDCLRLWGLEKWVGPPTAKLWTRLLRGLVPLLIPYLLAALAMLR